MFSREERCIYRRNQLVEVICQLRFPTILAIGAREPVDFQEAIRGIFPNYQLRHDRIPPKVTAEPGQPAKVEPQKPIVNHQFATVDGRYRINLSQGFISLTCNGYTSWEDFARMMDKPLASFIEIYKPAHFERVGLRYLNAVSRKQLGLEQLSWKELIEPCYLGMLAAEDVNEGAFSRCTQDVEMALPGNCRLKLHVGPGLVRRGQSVTDGEVKMILDLDVSVSGSVPVSLAASSMQTVHVHADSVFRGAITDTLHDAMEPEE